MIKPLLLIYRADEIVSVQALSLFNIPIHRSVFLTQIQTSFTADMCHIFTGIANGSQGNRFRSNCSILLQIKKKKALTISNNP